MKETAIKRPKNAIVRRVPNSTVTSMQVVMLSRDEPGLLDNVKCLIQEDPATAKDLLQPAIEVQVASIL